VPLPSLDTREDERGTWPLASLASLLRQGEFVLTAELNPPKSASASVVRRRADRLKGVVDAVNITDSYRANVAMAAIPAAVLVRDTGVEPIVQVTGRDRNRIAIQADLLGAAALGLPNFLFMSGDDPTQGNHPDAVHVQDLDGVELVRAAASLREGKFLNGDEVKQPPRYFIGATASPAAPKDVERTLEKIAAGAQFLQTQPVFDVAPFSQWLAEIRRRDKDVAILAGVLVLRSAEQAERLAKVPGIAVPDEIRARLRDAADGEAEGIAIAAETVRSLRALPGVNGVHLYAIEWPEAVPLVVRAAGGLLPRPTVKEVATA
jgi:5,10-methylenetetrahydrofolate reductase